MDVSQNLFVIGIKDIDFDKTESEEELIKKHIVIEIILNMIIGKSSSLYKKLYEEGIIMSEPYMEYEFDKTYAHVAITGQSKNPSKVFTSIIEQIQKYKEA